MSIWPEVQNDRSVCALGPAFLPDLRIRGNLICHLPTTVCPCDQGNGLQHIALFKFQPVKCGQAPLQRDGAIGKPMRVMKVDRAAARLPHRLPKGTGCRGIRKSKTRIRTGLVPDHRAASGIPGQKQSVRIKPKSGNGILLDRIQRCQIVSRPLVAIMHAPIQRFGVADIRLPAGRNESDAQIGEHWCKIRPTGRRIGRCRIPMQVDHKRRVFRMFRKDHTVRQLANLARSRLAAALWRASLGKASVRESSKDDHEERYLWHRGTVDTCKSGRIVPRNLATIRLRPRKN